MVYDDSRHVFSHLYRQLRNLTCQINITTAS